MTDCFEQLKETGKWWSDPWWLQDKYLGEINCSRQELLKVMDTLKSHFDETWTKKLANNPIQNIVFPELCLQRGLKPLSFMVTLGQIIDRLKNKRGIKQKIKDLKGHKSESAFFELELADIFAEHNYEVSFPKEGKEKSPDIIVDFPETELAIECKRLEEEAWIRWERELLLDGIRAVPDEFKDQELNYQIRLDPRLSELRLKESEEPELNRAIYQSLIDEIERVIGELCRQAQGYAEKPVEGLGFFKVGHKSKVPDTSISVMQISDASTLRRILSNGIFRAAKQLPNKLPGIIAVFAPKVPKIALVRLVLDAITKSSPSRFGHVAAILFFEQGTIFESKQPMMYINRFCRFEEEGREANRILRNSLKPALC